MKNTEKQKLYRARKKEAGYKRVSLYLSEKDFLRLQILSMGSNRTYSQVIAAALRGKLMLCDAKLSKKKAQIISEKYSRFKCLEYPKK